MRAGAISLGEALGVIRSERAWWRSSGWSKPMRVADLEVIGRDEARALVAAHHLDRLRGPCRYWRGARERPQARLVDQDHEGRRAAVEDRHLGAVHLDEHVVDAQAGERREQMLDGARPRRRRAAEGGGVVLRAEVGEGGRDLDAQVGADGSGCRARRARA